MSRYPIPARRVRHEIMVVNSRFIASLGPVFSVEEARRFIAGVRAEFPDASHHVPAFLIGHGASETAHCSDDGEPSRTAGRPALAVLRGSGLGDVCLVVTRYFGGTKLGAGGLVRAYSEAARQALRRTPRAERLPVCTAMMACAYPYFERLRLLIAAHGGQLVDQDFGAEVTLTARFPLERFPAFQAALSELTNGSSQAEVIEQGEMIIPLAGPAVEETAV
jgi:uncharacterized YigZ family protein